MSSITDIGDYLRSLRGKRSLREIERLSGVSNTYLSSLEKGVDPRTGSEIIPSPDILRKLSDSLGVTYRELMIKAGYYEELEMEYEADERRRYDAIEKIFEEKNYSLHEQHGHNKYETIIRIDDNSAGYPEDVKYVSYAELLNHGESILKELMRQKNEYSSPYKIVSSLIQELIDEIKHPMERDYIDDFEDKFEEFKDWGGSTIGELKSMVYGIDENGDPLPLFEEDVSEKMMRLLDLLEQIEESEAELSVLKANFKKTADLTYNAKRPDITYNGHPLTDQDRQRVQDMLKALFPEYQQPASEPG